jgi:hypothetical protein
MTSLFVNGAKYAVATPGTPIAVTAISNANPGVASVVTPPTDGTIGILESGWTDLNDSVIHTTGATEDAFSLAGVDTTSVTEYPAGQGVGTFAAAGAFTGLSQVRTVDMAGGDQQFFQWQYVEDKSGRQRQKPTFKNAMTLTMTMDYDPTLAWYTALIAADAARSPVILRETLPDGDVIYYYAYPSFNKVPTKTINEYMTNTATFSLISDPVRVAAA